MKPQQKQTTVEEFNPKTLRVGIYDSKKRLLYVIRYQGGKREGLACATPDRTDDNRWFMGLKRAENESWADLFDRAVSACARHYSREHNIPLEKVAFVRGEAPAPKQNHFLGAPMLPRATLDKLNPLREK